MKVGDKVKCIKKDAMVYVGSIYTIVENKLPQDHDIISIDHGHLGVYTYYQDYFELVVDSTLDRIKKLVEHASTLVGKSVHCKDKPNTYNIKLVDQYEVVFLQKDACTHSPLVENYFNKHGFVVFVSGNGFSIPVDYLVVAPSEVTIELTDDYDAVITADEVKVGCQTITRKKMEELMNVMNDLRN